MGLAKYIQPAAGVRNVGTAGIWVSYLDAEGMLIFRPQSEADSYAEVRRLISAATGMSPSMTGEGIMAFQDPSDLEAWLNRKYGTLAPVEEEVMAEAAVESPVARQIREIQEITSLNDQQLAAALPGGVSRETVNRWKNDASSNLRAPNLHRIGALHQLALSLRDAGIDAPVWLHQPLKDGTDSPFVLLCQGLLGDVETGVANAALSQEPNAPMERVQLYRSWDERPDDDDYEDIEPIVVRRKE